MNPQQLTEYLTRVVQPRLATVEGVADAQILGAQQFAMRVWIDPVALAARMVTATDVLTAITRSNFLSAPGKTKNEYYAYSIEAKTTLQDPETFGELPVRANGDDVVRLHDVAKIELTNVRFRDNAHLQQIIWADFSKLANTADMTVACGFTGVVGRRRDPSRPSPRAGVTGAAVVEEAQWPGFRSKR
jgi:multidrug efflux pump subunit AcrB